jgi:hypothetical protein
MKKEIEMQVERDKELREIQGAIDEAEALKSAVVDEIKRVEEALPAICAKSFMADDGGHVDDMASLGALKGEREYLDFAILGLRGIAIPNKEADEDIERIKSIREGYEEIIQKIKTGAEILPYLRRAVKHSGGDLKKAIRSLENFGFDKVSMARFIGKHVDQGKPMAKSLGEGQAFETMVLESTGRSVTEWAEKRIGEF